MKKPSIQRVAYQYLNKKANDDFKEKLLALINSDKIEFINQALLLQEELNILTEEELSNAVISIVLPHIFLDRDYWEQGGIGWEFLSRFPNNPLWNNLTEMSLSFLKLTSLPKEIENLKNLRALRIHEDLGITSLPSWIGNLTKLETLVVRKNKNFTSLPKEIGRLTRLKELTLSNNNLMSIPKEIGNLKKLESLELSDNVGLRHLPFKEIGKLGNLRHLGIFHLFGIRWQDVPENLKNITRHHNKGR